MKSKVWKIKGFLGANKFPSEKEFYVKASSRELAEEKAKKHCASILCITPSDIEIY